MTETRGNTFDDPAGPLTTTGSGPVRGLHRAGITSFLGIPYAAPPLGPLRFAAPARPRPWNGIRDATTPGQASLQELPAAPLVPKAVPATGEDCLTVNVWTPAARPGENLPVIVWLHGGGFSMGSASEPCYSGEELARRGAVVIGVNYRLGALGYLYLPQEAATGGIRANFGLLDQAHALQWVQENATAFGGDPGNVTAVGQSAGAYSILALAAMEQTRTLFHRAVLQSTPFAVDDHDLTTAQNTTTTFLQAAGIPHASRTELLNLTPQQILKAQRETFTQWTGTGPLDRPFVPITDGNTLTAKPAQSAFNGSLDHHDLLIGCTAEEALFFPPPPGHSKEDTHKLNTHINELFTQGVLRLGNHHARTNNPARLFWWKYPNAGPQTLRACHCAELPFLFGNPEQWTGSPLLTHGTPDDHTYLTNTIQNAWTNFATTGNPDPHNTLGWTPYTTHGHETLTIDTPTHQTPHPHKEHTP